MTVDVYPTLLATASHFWQCFPTLVQLSPWKRSIFMFYLCKWLLNIWLLNKEYFAFFSISVELALCKIFNWMNENYLLLTSCPVPYDRISLWNLLLWFSSFYLGQIPSLYILILPCACHNCNLTFTGNDWVKLASVH
jgi:hypothetical protein